MPDATVAVLLVGLVVAAALTAEGIRRRNGPAAVNGVAAIVLVVTPAAAETALQPGTAQPRLFGPAVVLWFAVAGVIHQLGMLGLYESVSWWDHLTHTVSAGLVAAATYALVLEVPDVPFPGDAGPSPPTVGVTTVGVTLVVGVCWEVLELAAHEAGHWLAVEPLLVPYGRRDTALDLVFDVVGAAIVLALDLRTFVPAAAVAARHPTATRTALAWTAGALLGGTAALGVAVLVAQWRRG
jgi:hypothetical protein